MFAFSLRAQPRNVHVVIYTLWCSGIWLWKHVPPSLWIPNNAHFHVAMVRDPLAWMAAMRKAPYGLSCQSESLTSPCFLRPVNTWGPLATGIFIRFSSIMAVWNYYYSAYSESVHFVRYEDLVLQYHSTMVGISSEAQLYFSRNISHGSANQSIPQGPSKKHGESKTFKEALMYVQSQGWLKRYSRSELEIACKALNITLMKKFNYATCDALEHLGSPVRAEILAKLKPVAATKQSRVSSERYFIESQNSKVAACQNGTLEMWQTTGMDLRISFLHVMRNQSIFRSQDQCKIDQVKLSASQFSAEQICSTQEFFFTHYFSDSSSCKSMLEPLRTSIDDAERLI